MMVEALPAPSQEIAAADVNHETASAVGVVEPPMGLLAPIKGGHHRLMFDDEAPPAAELRFGVVVRHEVGFEFGLQIPPTLPQSG
jgi:hypothetical protein